MKHFAYLSAGLMGFTSALSVYTLDFFPYAIIFASSTLIACVLAPKKVVA